MFKELEQKSIEVIVDAIKQIAFRSGSIVIKQGEPGDCLYIVESGILSCSKRFTKDAEPKFLREYHEGEMFGELALLYNVPRGATIISKTNSILWSLDRETFNSIVKAATMYF